MTTHGSVRDERGASAVLVALVTCFVLFGVAALTVDLGNTWARRGLLQAQVDRAVKFAAERLPVDTTTVGAPTVDQLRVASAAAYYLACNRVSGQADLSTIPACPSAGPDTFDAGIDTLARAMLTNGAGSGTSAVGAITFPTVNKVSITAPDALVTFGFARTLGADSSVQTKSATAVVLSPGELLPVGMSLSCMANALGTAPLGAGDTASNTMPINYVSTGSGAPLSTAPVTPTPTPYDWSAIAQAPPYPAGLTINAASTVSPSGSVHLVIDYSSGKAGWTLLSITVYIRKIPWTTGDPTYSQTIPITILQQGNVNGTTTFDLQLPAGQYTALIGLSGRNGGLGHELDPPTSWFNNFNQNPGFTVPNGGQLAHFVSCARPAQSPRLGISSDSDAMSVNIAQGLDHGLQAFPGLADAVDNVNIGVGSGTAVSTAASLLGSAGISALTCGTNSAVKKDYPTRRTDGPNCLYVDTSVDWSAELTKGLLTGGTFGTGSINGRLKCPASGSCNYKSSRPTLSAPGGIAGTYNDDHFSDFVLTAGNGSPRYLSDPFFMALDTMISPSVPLVTPPNDSLETALYSSPRFFWAPFVVSAWPTSGAGDYSILTFRPVFLTSDTSSTITTPIDTLLLGLIQQSISGGLLLPATLTALGASTSCRALGDYPCELSLLRQADISGLLTTFLGTNTVVEGGLVIDVAAGRVRAARIMTLAPGALPAVPRAYSGPTTDYLGVGPKIVRLTQ